MTYRVSVRSNIADSFLIVLILLIPLILTACMNIHVASTNQPAKLIEVNLVTPTKYVPTATFTITPSPTIKLTQSPTITPSPSLTPTESTTPTLTNTITPGPITGNLNSNSRCRTGPGIVYPISAYLISGESVLVQSRNFDASWVFIVKESTSEACWVNSILLNIDVKLDVLSLMTPPPTPKITPSPTPSATKIKEKQNQEKNTPTPAPPYPSS